MTTRTPTAPAEAPPSKKHRIGGRSARVLEQVVEAVAAELREGGLASFSVPRVAQRAGVHTATIYRRWPTKAELLAFATGRLAAEALPVPDTGSLRGDLLTILRDVRDFLDAPVGEMMVAAAFGVGNTPELQEMLRLYWSERVADRRAMFARARLRGEIWPEGDPEELIERAIGPVYVRRFISRRPVDDGFIERTVDSVLAFVGQR